MKVILASASPRRKELLAQILPDFEIIPAQGEEKADSSLSPERTVSALAEHKCDEVFKNNPEATVIGCDTVVVFENEILGKPKNREDAFNTLKRLSGNTHFVITAVCVRSGHKKIVEFERTTVKFYNLSDEFINSYVDSGSPFDKAGSYGIQDGGLVKEYFGDYENVVGLPLTLTKKLLKKVNVEV